MSGEVIKTIGTKHSMKTLGVYVRLHSIWKDEFEHAKSNIKRLIKS